MPPPPKPNPAPRAPDDDVTGDAGADFEAWRRGGDPDALARVFDALAPGLLRLGVHLVGAAHAAEDLVQATFVAAIERRDAFDPARGDVGAWLAGILANLARSERRSRALAPDPERLDERVTRTPLEHALAAELDGELAAALDELAEPYRTALVLRLRHGLGAAEVAHALGISSGAARTRLSRGMERLRRRLPGALALPALVPAVSLPGGPDLAGASRGLDAVREAVLAHASAAGLATAAAFPTFLGGLVVSKKILAVCAAVVALCAALAWNRGDRDATPMRAEAAAEPAALAADRDARDVRAVSEPAPRAREAAEGAPTEVLAVAPRPAAELVAMRGIVSDADTSAPLANVEVVLVAAGTRTASELLREGRDLPVRRQLHAGSIASYGAVPRLDGDPFRIAPQLDTIAPRVFTAPDELALERPLARTLTDADGAFRMDVPRDGGTLLLRLDGYPDRALPAPRPGGDWTIRLRRARRLAGVAIDRATGAPVDESVELVFWGSLEAWVDADEPARSDPDAAPVGDATFAVTARTDAAGRFDVELPLTHAQIEPLSPGWVTADFVSRATGGAPVEIRLERAPYLSVVDAATGAPIDEIRLLAYAVGRDDPRWCARLFGEDGRYSLATNRSQIHLNRDDALTLLVWADGYAPVERPIPALAEERAIEIALRPGSAPAVAGSILFGGEPVDGAQVLLQPFYRRQWSAKLDGAQSIDGMRTAADGRYAVSAPAGPYVLRVAHGEQVFAERIELGEAGLTRSIDLATLGAIAVTVSTSAGAPSPDHSVVLRDGAGRSEWATTDAAGLAALSGLAAGEYELRAPLTPGRGSFSAGIVEPVTVRAGLTTPITLSIPAPETRFARLRAPGEGDLTRFSVRSWNVDWADVEPGGRIPIDLATLAGYSAEIEHADGRNWSVRVPTDAEDGYVIELPLDGPTYEGRLLHRGTGAPIGGAWVQAYPLLSEGASRSAFPAPRARTDVDGRFRLVSRAETPHHLQFAVDAPGPFGLSDRGGRLDFSSYDRRLGGAGFRASEPPTDAGTPLEIRVAYLRGTEAVGATTRELSGVVRRASTGEPAGDVQVWIRAEERQTGGVLSLSSVAGRAVTGFDGRFTVTVAALDELLVTLDDRADPDGASVERRVRADEIAGGELNLELP